MPRKVFLLILYVLVLGTLPFFNKEGYSSTEGNIRPLDSIEKDDRILILAPHPDDETIACAGVIQNAIAKGAQLKVVYLTNGDHNQLAFIVYEKRITLRKGEFIHMGRVRRKEAIAAMRLLGVNEKNLVFLGYPDFGTFSIFARYWKSEKPFKSMLTRISKVPYKENFSFGSAYKAENILKDIEAIISEYKPNKIFVSHPADTNVDHKAFYLFLQIALLNLQDKIPPVKVYPYLVHCVGWPLPRHYHPQLDLNPPKQFQNAQINWMRLELTPEQLDKKYRAILCYKSQTRSSAFYLLSFARKNELFGDYPAVELKKQVSLKEQAVSFFGFSDLYQDFEDSALANIDTQISGIKSGQVSYAVVDNSLFVRIEKTAEFNYRLVAQLYLFGYSSMTPFDKMPKIRILVKGKKIDVYNQNTKVNSKGASSETTPQVFILKIPLDLLGKPDMVLASIRSFRGKLPVDVTGFRKLLIK
ncbi:MAG: PIG-L family deacetylase [Candidatus Omnitrophica bacterium]|nr:PIG-L family deacetylase [Candidatus Omnitrophota bacterium]